MAKTQRVVIAKEGVEMPDGRIIQPHAVRIEDVSVPVFFNYTEPPVGIARHFKRDVNLELSCELEMEDDDFDFEDWHWSSFLSNVFTAVDSENTYIVRGLLKAVVFYPKGANP